MIKFFNKYFWSDLVYKYIRIPKYKKILMKNIGEYVPWDMTHTLTELIFSAFEHYYKTSSHYARIKKSYKYEGAFNIFKQIYSKLKGFYYLSLSKLYIILENKTNKQYGLKFYHGSASDIYYSKYQYENEIYKEKLKKYYNYKYTPKELREEEIWKRWYEFKEELRLNEYNTHQLKTMELEEIIYNYIINIRKANYELEENVGHEQLRYIQFDFIDIPHNKENIVEPKMKQLNTQIKDGYFNIKYWFDSKDRLWIERIHKKEKDLNSLNSLEITNNLLKLDTKYMQLIIENRMGFWD